MKTVRQVAILDIIEKQEIETQEELASALNARGIRVTQATVSRDIQADNNLTDRFIRMLAESLLSVSSANNLIVVKTLSGSANVAAEALDSMHWPEVLGTLAGDNTVLLIIRSNEETITVTSRIREMMK